MHWNLVKKTHSAVTLAAIGAAFPAWLRDDVSIVMAHVPPVDSEPHVGCAYRFTVGDHRITVPSRVYFTEMHPADFGDLTRTQTAILAAIMTRHLSGYQREEWSEPLSTHPADWTTPFVALLMGDYVREILAMIERNMATEWQPLFRDFADNNPEWRRSLTHRIVTYWDMYYRRLIPRLPDYPGYRVAERLGLWDKKSTPRLTRGNKRSDGNH